MRNTLFFQQGWLISGLFTLWILFIAILFLPSNNIDHADFDSQIKLQQIQQALIAWSVNSDTPGSLPCPEDTNLLGTINEGSAKSSCLSQVNIGFLPWRTLGLGKIRDSHGDPYIYLIASGFTKSPINSASLSNPNLVNLRLDGNPIVALIASPGYQISHQQRQKNSSQLKHYFEGLNADGDNQFFSMSKCGGCNDLLLGVTPKQLFSSVNMRVLREVRGDETQGLIKYWQQNHFFPYADTNQDGYADSPALIGTPSYQAGENNLTYYTSWLKRNNWYEQIQYQLSPDRHKVVLSIQQQVLQVSP